MTFNKRPYGWRSPVAGFEDRLLPWPSIRRRRSFLQNEEDRTQIHDGGTLHTNISNIDVNMSGV